MSNIGRLVDPEITRALAYVFAQLDVPVRQPAEEISKRCDECRAFMGSPKYHLGWCRSWAHRVSRAATCVRWRPL